LDDLTVERMADSTVAP